MLQTYSRGRSIFTGYVTHSLVSIASSVLDRMTGAHSPDFIACGRAYEREEQKRFRFDGSRAAAGYRQQGRQGCACKGHSTRMDG
jgi:hypothetical protein